MNPLIAAFAGLIAGVAIYLFVPIVAAAVSEDAVDRVKPHYLSTAMALLGRALLIKRKHGGFYLKKSTFDAKFGKEMVMINGEKKYFEDPENLMSRLAGWPFGIAHEKSQTIGDARFAELGEHLLARARTGKLVLEHNGEKFVNGFVRVADSDTRLVNPDNFLPLLSGDADPGTTDWSVEVTKKSQTPFESANVIDYVGALAAFGVPFGAMWLAKEALGGGGNGGSTLPLLIDTMGVVPL